MLPLGQCGPRNFVVVIKYDINTTQKELVQTCSKGYDQSFCYPQQTNFYIFYFSIASLNNSKFYCTFVLTLSGTKINHWGLVYRYCTSFNKVLPLIKSTLMFCHKASDFMKTAKGALEMHILCTEA